MDGKKRRPGRAPFASVEDLSDESPPEERSRLAPPRMAAPRIDISRASSSSHHDDSSPERDLFPGSGISRIGWIMANNQIPAAQTSQQEGGVEGANGAKYGLGFTEEMALELRSSTEELDFQDPNESETKARRKKLQQQQAVTKYELEAQSEKEPKERKDSACSEGGFLLISGRTSRLSSIGSAASGGSVASHVSGSSAVSAHSHISAISGASHLSAVSNYSKASRCSSPHRMMLETSFCGPKPIPTVSLEAEYPPRESVEATLLARKTDPTGAVLPPDESINTGKIFSGKSTLDIKSVQGAQKGSSDGRHKPTRSSSERIANSQMPNARSVQTRSSSARVHSKPKDSKPKQPSNELFKIIPLHGSLDEPEDTTEDMSTDTNERPPSPPEYGIYIPLKGPEIDYSKKVESTPNKSEPTKKPPIEESDLVRFISLHGDDDEELERSRTMSSLQSNCRNENIHFRPRSETQVGRDKHHVRKSRTPDPDGKFKLPSLDLATKQGRAGQTLTKQPHDESRTPSPATSFTRGTFFRRSSDSSSSSKKSASASGSGESKMKKDSKNKSVFSSFFKKVAKEKELPPRKSHEKTPIDTKITNVEFTFKQQEKKFEGDQIIIPLHSPDSIIEPCILLEPDQVEIKSQTRSKPRPTELAEIKQTATATASFVKAEQQAIEKNVIVVDVINEDVREPNVFKVEPLRLADSVQSTIELEDFETEPKVLKSQNICDTETSKPQDNLSPEAPQEKVETISESVPKETIEPHKTEADTKETVEVEEPEAPKIETSEQEIHRSSESEADSEGVPQQVAPCEEIEEDDTERKGLFHQTDSQEDELPYVPTTLPQERSIAVPIIPVRQRIAEVKTCPIDRPRSTTPINPSTLDEYAAAYDEVSSPGEKMQITLPRADSIGKSKSPGRGGKPWTEFAERCLQSPKEGRKGGTGDETTPPPLPPRSAPPPPWVSFDELPERRRAPRRITTLPRAPTTSATAAPAASGSPPVLYSYVNPEECSCECHEAQTKINSAQCPSDKGRCSYNQKDRRTEREKHYRS